MASFDDNQLLPWTGMTIKQARNKLSGLHFSQESLTEGEREILYIAEGLLRLVDPESYQSASKLREALLDHVQNMNWDSVSTVRLEQIAFITAMGEE